MPLTLLLDLDDTLLDTNTEVFLDSYYDALARYLDNHVPRAEMLSSLAAGINRMLSNTDPSRTLQQAFEAEFYSRLKIPKDELSQSIRDFYATIFPRLRRMTRERPEARKLVEWARTQGHHLAIATNPLFPRQAILERVRWAGLEPEQFELISSFESFHFAKPHPAFFAEFIGRMGWPDHSMLMVGNDMQRDLVPARQLGLPTYHVNGAQAAGTSDEDLPQQDSPAHGQGDLAHLQSWLQAVRLAPFTPAFKSREAILGMLRATPAVLQALVSDLDPAIWKKEPSAEDWAMIELVCHLRDTEREVHRLQINTLLASQDPFVPRPDAAVWAKQRRYLNEDGPAAVRELLAARLETLARLEAVPAEVWSRPARHAIFGPTRFMEVIGFMADHDRMHLQQAWNTLAALARLAHRK